MNSAPCFCIGHVLIKHISKKLKFKPCCNQTNKQTHFQSQKSQSLHSLFFSLLYMQFMWCICAQPLINKVYKVNCDRQFSYHSHLSIKKVYFEVLFGKRDLNMSFTSQSYTYRYHKVFLLITE